MSGKEDGHLHWHEVSRKVLADCRIFQVCSALREDPRGKKAERYLIEAPDWVTAVPLVVREGREYCLMVKQYRQGSDSVTWEFPAGTVDPGEEPGAAMERELLEETGARTGKLTLLGQVNPNSAFMTNTQFIYAAEDLEFTGTQDLDEHEEVEFFLMPLEEVRLRMGTPPLDNGTMMTALAFFLRNREQIGKGGGF